MAWSNSKIFSAFVADSFNQTATFDLNTHTIKVALYDNDITPDQAAASANTAYNAGQWANTNEVTDGSEWPAGGVALSSLNSGFASNVYTFDAADTASGASATLANVFGCDVYDDSLTTPVADQGICYIYFGGSNEVTDGQLTIQWSGSGIFRITL
jgi:hypothetical protein